MYSPCSGYSNSNNNNNNTEMVFFSRIFLATLLLHILGLSSSFSSVLKNGCCGSDHAKKGMGRPTQPVFSHLIMRSNALNVDQLDNILDGADKIIVNKGVQVANHIPTFASIAYFGLISMASMMESAPSVGATLVSVLTKRVGPTSNGAFSSFFPTLVTPPSFIFLIWPIISIAQLATVTISALRPGNKPLLSQDNLSALSLANLAATGWLIVSSTASPGNLPLGSFLVLPFVPLLSGFPLRTAKADGNRTSLKNFVFQVFSSFTTLASVLAFTVELQHGGRIPFFHGKAELCACLFLGIYAFVVGLPNRCLVKKFVNAGVVSGILWKRIAESLKAGVGSLPRLFLSVSFLGTAAVTWLAIDKLLRNEAIDKLLDDSDDGENK